VSEVLHGWKPHPCIAFAIDPASLSGWAMLAEVAPKFIISGLAKTAADRRAVVEAAVLAKEKRGLPVIAIVEDFTPGGWKSFDAILRTGQSRGRWLDHLELAGIPVVSVEPQMWRGDIYGARAAKMKREQAKSIAQTYVRAEFKREVDHNEAEAILIARWGTRARAVADLLDPPRRTRQGSRRQ
jgi:hypothetical protein